MREGFEAHLLAMLASSPRVKALGLLCLLLLTFAAIDLRAAQSRAVPDLPSLALENFSPGIRNQIQEASADALSHPDDPAATGRLGMVLQTYGLLNEAALCYRRAMRLALSDFRWAYYLGRVEASQGYCNEATTTLRSALSEKPDYVPAQLQLA